MTLAGTCVTLALLAATPVAQWDFEDGLGCWQPNVQVEEVAVEGGIVSGRIEGGDAFFACREMSMEATPWQYVVLRIKCDIPGVAELFWSDTLEGEHGGLSQEMSVRFNLAGSNEWQEVAVFPLWHTLSTIKQMRLDLYDGLAFEWDSIAVHDWGEGNAPLTDAYAWEGGFDAWRRHEASPLLLSPPLALGVSERPYISLQARATEPAPLRIVWVHGQRAELQSESIDLIADGEVHTYNILVGGLNQWQSPLRVLGVEAPSRGELTIERLAIAQEPAGPAELRVNYFGFANAVNRAGNAAELLLKVQNQGGKPAPLDNVKLEAPPGLEVLEAPEAEAPLKPGQSRDLHWRVRAEEPGEKRVHVAVGDGLLREEATLDFLPRVDVEKAEYAPAPEPVPSEVDVCMYYFPGWNNQAKWAPVRLTAPIRKPLLGYYDEGNPEVVDWQIKWARENGINCFLVDWYWSEGRQMLTHWFEAYRDARYRDQLQVAIMWANHNAPDTHSREDWREVTREWIERYFNLPAYYPISGKPSVFIWSPENIRRDVGGSEVVREMLEESQQMARDAGYPGITFVAMQNHVSPASAEQLAAEGYDGVTSYHEWGEAPALAQSPRYMRFEDVAETTPEVWERKLAQAEPLDYYPLVDTGWDARPWHGSESSIIWGRTPELFKQLLREARTFVRKHDLERVVMGPANEWGEGSYIEPNTEFGFEMYEAVREVFGEGSEADWPRNLAPRDVGLGPYDLRMPEPQSEWDFSGGLGSWDGMMGVAEVRAEGDALQFVTTSDDPALVAPLFELPAEKYATARIRMKLSGDGKQDRAQLFWSMNGHRVSEASSVAFEVTRDGEWHVYELDLAANPRWRGAIASFRFDPCTTRGVQIAVDRIELLP